MKKHQRYAGACCLFLVYSHSMVLTESDSGWSSGSNGRNRKTESGNFANAGFLNGWQTPMATVAKGSCAMLPHLWTEPFRKRRLTRRDLFPYLIITPLNTLLYSRTETAVYRTVRKVVWEIGSKTKPGGIFCFNSSSIKSKYSVIR